MQTHDNREHSPELSKMFEELSEKAAKMTRERTNTITAGKAGEEPLDRWQHGDLWVTKMPDDEHNLLRISVGGPGKFAYCTYRGDREGCLKLLREAVEAMEQGGGA